MTSNMAQPSDVTDSIANSWCRKLLEIAKKGHLLKSIPFTTYRFAESTAHSHSADAKLPDC